MEEATPRETQGIGRERPEETLRRRAEEALRESEEQLAAEADALARLNDASSRLWGIGSLREGLDEMLSATIELLRADMGNIQLFDAARGVLTIVSQQGFKKEFLDFFREVSTRDESACGRALRSGERSVIEDIETDAPYAPLRAIARAAGYRAVQSTPILDRDGNPLGMFSTHWRRTHRPSEDELRRLDLYVRQAANFIERCRTDETLREADRRKDVFLAMLAHELRNPLGAVTSALQVMRMSDPSRPAWQRAMEVVGRQIKHQARLVDDLLDVSRITQGKIHLRRRPVDLTRIVRETAEDHRAALEGAGLTLTHELAARPVCVEGDATRLAQVLGNLLQNSIKFTERGGHVTVRMALEPASRRVAVAVRDSGVGIEPEMLPRVFDVFAQADRTLHRSPGGLGIGLALVKGLVDLHGGEVQATSAGRGHGAEFTFFLPLVGDTAAAGDASTASGGETGPVRVLIIEDNRDAADALRDMLDLYGYSVQVACSGTEGLEAARQLRPDVILCDLGLPGLDGYAVASALRQEPETASIHLVAVSGYGQEEDQRRSREAGFDRHLTKPVDPDEMERLLASASFSL